MSFKRKLKDIASYLAINGVTCSMGYGLAKYYEIVANANVKVRPELANVDFWTAFFANHGTDWLFYHMPDIMEKIFIGGGIAIGTLLYLYLKYR